MVTMDRIKDYLDKRHIIYDVREIPSSTSLLQASDYAGVSPSFLLRTAVVKDDVGLLMVVMPATSGLDIAVLSSRLYRRVGYPGNLSLQKK